MVRFSAAVLLLASACTSTSSSPRGSCAAPGCLTLADCSADDVACVAGRCVECSVDSDCRSGPRECDAALGICKRCVSDFDCQQPVGATPSRPSTGLCDSDTYTCTRCTTDSDCSLLGPSMKYCANQSCIGCRSDFDCAGSSAGSYCIQQQCARCQLDAECIGQPFSGCDATTGTCSKCQSDHECLTISLDAMCDPDTRRCTCPSSHPASADSPFALQAPFLTQRPEDQGAISQEESLQLLSGLGAREVRLLLPELDTSKERLRSLGISISCDLGQPFFPSDMEAHKREALDIASKNRSYVHAWILVNEAESNWKDTPKRYAEYFVATSRAVKAGSPEALVVLNLAGTPPDGAAASPEGLAFLDAALKNGVGPHFDVLDIHVQGSAFNYRQLSAIVAAYHQVFDSNGVARKPIWHTEFGTHDGDPDEDPALPGLQLPFQSEAIQASGLIKKYVHGLSAKVHKMFWTGLVEWSNYEGAHRNSYFDNTGLVNSANNDGQSHRKLAYYAYHKMIEVLDGSDWSTFQDLSVADDVYVFRVLKDGRPVWIAWNDGPQARSASLSVGAVGTVRITEAVPRHSSGKEVSDLGTAFRTESKVPQSRQVALDLTSVPVFVEVGP
ncbi:MAG: hypothetical protein HY901_18760 [Deltaproteobacteria bacterium]|nr:hypothetical protein [Deltaproteobacteria bacterium]